MGHFNTNIKLDLIYVKIHMYIRTDTYNSIVSGSGIRPWLGSNHILAFSTCPIWTTKRQSGYIQWNKIGFLDCLFTLKQCHSQKVTHYHKYCVYIVSSFYIHGRNRIKHKKLYVL